MIGNLGRFAALRTVGKLTLNGLSNTGYPMIRAIIVILILAIVILLAGIGTGFIDINQIRGAKAPEVSATQNGVTAKGGQTPAFDVETGSVTVGTKDAQVKVPAVQVNPPADANQVANNAQ